MSGLQKWDTSQGLSTYTYFALARSPCVKGANTLQMGGSALPRLPSHAKNLTQTPKSSATSYEDSPEAEKWAGYDKQAEAYILDRKEPSR